MSTDKETQRLTKWLIIWWWIALIFAAPLYLRLLYEQTFLTWAEGRQMVGFSLVHLHPEILFLGLVGDTLFAVWLLTAVGFLVMKKKKLAGSTIAYFAIPTLAMVINFIPYDFWSHLGGVE